HQLQTSWGDDDGLKRTWELGTNNPITYSLPDVAPALPPLYDKGDHTEADGFVAMTDWQKAFAREAFEMWDDLIAVSLNETTSETARITLAYSDNTGDRTFTRATLDDPGGSGGAADVHPIEYERIWMSTDAKVWPELQSYNLTYGNRGLEV